MKTLVILVLLTLICFLHHSTAVLMGPQLLKGECCPNYNRHGIPKGRVKHVEMTPDHCQNKAIIVTTVCKKVCIDPNWGWAKKLLSEFKSSTANSTAPPAPLNVFKC